MARVKGAMMTRKRRNKILKLAKGYWGAKSKHFKMANQAVMKSGVGINAGLHNGLVGHLVVLGLSTPIALGQLQDLISSLARHHCAFNTCHCSISSLFLLVQDHALDSGLVGLVSDGGAAQGTLELGGLAVTVEQVTLLGHGALDLAGLSEGEALLGAAVGLNLNLRHNR